MTLSLYAPSSGDAENPAKSRLPGIADEVLAKANAAIERLAAEYPKHARRDIADMEQHAANMASDRDNRALHYHEILRIAHDVRGQGALFGYPLMTRCAGSLCRVVRTFDPDDDEVLGLVQTHVTALYAILHRHSGSACDPSALFMATGLELLVMLRTAPRHGFEYTW